MVAGAAVLLRQAADEAGRTLSTAEILALLQATGTPVTDGDDELTNVAASGRTYARLDVSAALAALLPRLPRASIPLGTSGSRGGAAWVASDEIAGAVLEGSVSPSPSLSPASVSSTVPVGDAVVSGTALTTSSAVDAEPLSPEAVARVLDQPDAFVTPFGSVDESAEAAALSVGPAGTAALSMLPSITDSPVIPAVAAADYVLPPVRLDTISRGPTPTRSAGSSVRKFPPLWSRSRLFNQIKESAAALAGQLALETVAQRHRSH